MLTPMVLSHVKVKVPPPPPFLVLIWQHLSWKPLVYCIKPTSVALNQGNANSTVRWSCPVGLAHRQMSLKSVPLMLLPEAEMHRNCPMFPKGGGRFGQWRSATGSGGPGSFQLNCRGFPPGLGSSAYTGATMKESWWHASWKPLALTSAAYPVCLIVTVSLIRVKNIAFLGFQPLWQEHCFS